MLCEREGESGEEYLRRERDMWMWNPVRSRFPSILPKFLGPTSTPTTGQLETGVTCYQEQSTYIPPLRAHACIYMGSVGTQQSRTTCCMVSRASAAGDHDELPR